MRAALKSAIHICLLSLLTLAGCAASYPSRPSDPAYQIGANGLEFADGAQELADVEERSLNVTVARFWREGEAGETQIVVSEEEVILPPGFTAYEARDMVLTLDGETLTFVDGRATMASGQTVWSYLNYAMEHSATGGFYTYGKFSTPFEGEAVDSEGFFAVGFQTDPASLLGLTGNPTYHGSYFGYGQLLDGEGVLISEELQTIGAITIEADFTSARVSGQLNGFFDPEVTRTPYNMIFVNADIDGNTFAAAPDMICAAAASCTSATSLGGTFFGPDGVEISGVIGFDETTQIGPETTRFIGAAGFSSSRNPPEVVPVED